jgi:Fic-DOC domain mobile mystery protein B
LRLQDFEYPEGATPLDPDAAQGLIPSLTTQQELNEFEAAGIAAAFTWAMRSRILKRELLTVSGLLLLHRRMLQATWRWAGELRRHDTNIGVPSERVAVALATLCDDVAFQLESEVFPLDELAVRFHHRLVLVHPFPNGNGRHARLAADLLLHYNGQPMLSWGAGQSLVTQGEARIEYLAALREADGGDIARLLLFARS